MIRVLRQSNPGTHVNRLEELVADPPHLGLVLGSAAPLGTPSGLLIRYPWSMHLSLTGRLLVGLQEFSLAADTLHALVLEKGTEATQLFRDAVSTRWLSIYSATNPAGSLRTKHIAQYRVEISQLLAAQAHKLWSGDFPELAEEKELQSWVHGMIELAEERRVVLNSSFHRLPGQSMERRQQLGMSLVKVRDYLESNYQEHISINKLACIARMSRSSFIRSFREYFQITPGRYMKTLRMKHAREILSTRRCAVQEVANCVGYRNRSAFVRAFSHHFGYPPKHRGSDGHETAQVDTRSWSNQPLVL